MPWRGWFRCGRRCGRGKGRVRAEWCANSDQKRGNRLTTAHQRAFHSIFCTLSSSAQARIGGCGAGSGGCARRRAVKRAAGSGWGRRSPRCRPGEARAASVGRSRWRRHRGSAARRSRGGPAGPVEKTGRRTPITNGCRRWPGQGRGSAGSSIGPRKTQRQMRQRLDSYRDGSRHHRDNPCEFFEYLRILLP